MPRVTRNELIQLGQLRFQTREWIFMCNLRGPKDSAMVSSRGPAMNKYLTRVYGTFAKFKRHQGKNKA
jgi:hypothetical protein